MSTVAGCDRLFRLENGTLVEQGDVASVLKLASVGEQVAAS
jgi:hypothetical protein